MAFVVKHVTGILRADNKGEDLERFQISLKVTEKYNNDEFIGRYQFLWHLTLD